ncbi:PD-(D/E)XK nuclease family protein [Natronoflexus pectinivorans]|uniref:PD-(D/E)XK nuclease superfamily protein n=1 Tax=Natronoflexus pectinivorans TaxID=682526 RepID=A0A4R2GMR9_9BACT|nr:PD-(D/E)XK nuclease family protein [Natronoflexus pectinivorans]TCO08903.1 PD-(D/E)XK nuclease superfamily protein [Natronoflexus pectinivorans]
MQTFLEQLAHHYTSKHLTEINDFCFVFPSRRAGLFFSRYLSQQISRPVWAPKILTINEFFSEIDPTPVADSITLLFKLHLSYQKVMESDISIDEFIPIGEMLLGDFNDIDKYLAKPAQLFSNLAAIKALDDDFSHLSPEQVKAIQSFWSSFNPEKISEQQAYFLAQWEKMHDLYNCFRDDLKSGNEAYEGMVFRSVAENAVKEKSISIPWKKVVFAGFNALNECEKEVFRILQNQKKAHFFWDYPEWVFHDTNDKYAVQHEAARFLQSNLLNYPAPDDWQPPFSKKMADITIASATNELEQTRLANHYLKNMAENRPDPEKTALVLADEQQLLPVLHAIPEDFSAINITIGYSLKNTPAYALVENLLAMQKTTRKTKEGKTWFYHRDVLALLRHQYMHIITDGKNLELINKLIKANQLFIADEQLKDDSVISSIFKKTDTTEELTEYLNDILVKIYKDLEKGSNNQVEMEFIYHLYTVIKKLSDILATLPQKPAPETWQSLFKKIAAQEMVPFKGEPLQGLQVMGILETRAIDFENLVIIGLNEGIFPKTSPPNTSIPFNLRKGHGLPTIENQDSIFAYYFYRLIHRAKNIKLIHTTTRSVTEEGEKSRFLQQLYYEYGGNVTMESIHQNVTVPVHPEITASKTEDVMEILHQWTESGKEALSPSALSSYVECPLRFYYRYVAKIKEPDDISEDLDPRVFGNLFHQMVEDLYKPFVGKEVNPEMIKELRANKEFIRDTMDSIFVQNIPFIRQKSNIFTDLQGKNSLIYEILYKYILRFLECEQQDAPFQLLALEERVLGKLRISDQLTINIGGTIDRTDEKNGILRITDYKTGKAEKTIPNIERLFDENHHPANKAIFQTLLYSLIKSETANQSIITPGVISVKDLYGEYDNQLYLKSRQNKEVITLNLVKEEFVEQITTKLSELFNPEIPFRQTSNVKSCDYCTFKENCSK